MNTLERSIKDLTKELKRFNDSLPHLQKEMSKTETVKRLKEEKEERFQRMREFPRVELEDDQVHSI
ncbi:hypothetical protein [uncultured Mediterranean phage uvMED]|jgi:septal ring factor EnvC (AmiA/AmiB activator)|nr:hypothetical protein [uncultured Mediterranean phage uvMED]|tara:strand:+ start:1085 stop:1282 length:198 start_codon:yes stop_codon:yes gene_type:complete